MSPADLPRLLPILIPLAVLAVVLLRARRQQRIRASRLWIAPLFAALAIGSGLYFQPHPLFGLAQYAIMAVGAGLGIAAGMARAHTLRLSREAGSDVVLAQASPVAVLVIIVLLGTRMAMRQGSGIDMAGNPALVPGLWPATIIDASMLFALVMIVIQRVVLWRRIAALPA
jgi:hypothetical protein